MIAHSKKSKDRVQYRRPSDGSHGRFEAFLLSIMGPASIGENKAPEGYVPDEAALLCPRCGSSWDDHERVHAGNMTYRPCPRRSAP